MEKKLTDEEIVKALGHCMNNRSCEYCCHNYELGSGEIVCRSRLMWKTVDLIQRLTSLYDGKSGFMTSSIGDLPLTIEGLRKAVDEISRLLCVQAELQELNAKYYNEAKDLRRENAELQKQVDDLKSRKIEPLIVKCPSLETCPKCEQAVKEMAREILQELYDEATSNVRETVELNTFQIEQFAERYDVEVE